MTARGPEIPGARFTGKKKPHYLLKFIGSATTLWVLYPSEIMQMGFTGFFLARGVFAKSIKVLGWQPGAPNSREQGFPKKTS